MSTCTVSGVGHWILDGMSMTAAFVVPSSAVAGDVGDPDADLYG
jgi:hypothetical protein